MDDLAKQHEKRGDKITSLSEIRPTVYAPFAAGRFVIVPTRDPTWGELYIQGQKAEFEEYAVETTESYASMDKYYREYRRNWLVRGCINALAFWATKEGFDTILEPASPGAWESDEAKARFLESYKGLLDHVNTANRTVQLDEKLKQIIVKAKIHGRMGYEKQRNALTVTFLAPLRPTDYLPVVNRSWQLKGFSYKSQGTQVSSPYFQPEEVLHFANNDVDGNYRGLSDIEPILKEVQLDDKIIREDLTEAATVMWAPITLWMLDTEKLPQGTTQAQIQAIIDNHIAMIQSGVGRSIATDARWQVTVVEMKPDLDRLLNVSDKMERRILGNFKVPRFILNVEKELNRATAYAELEAFVDGPVTDVQRWLKRELERQWYDEITREWLTRNKALRKGQPLPVLVKHRWREIRTSDWFELIRAIAEAYANGQGFIDQVKAYELARDGTAAHFDPEELKKKQNLYAATAQKAR